MNQTFFIAGTDTEIGKTRIACGLLRAAAKAGNRTLGLKPVSAGCDDIDGTWMNEDARELMLCSSIQPNYETVNPVALREPMAPHIAAEREGVSIDAAELAEHCRTQSKTADFCVVEGAGGWLVPLDDHSGMDSLAVAIGAPVILVVGMRLGCINHSLLTVAAIGSAGLKLAGWVANRIDPEMAVYAENVATLSARIDAPLLGEVPWLADPSRAGDYLNLPGTGRGKVE